MDLETLAQQYREQGYTARGDILFSPNGHVVSGLIKTGGNVYFAEQIARQLAPMRSGRRSLVGTVWHSRPVRF